MIDLRTFVKQNNDEFWSVFKLLSKDTLCCVRAKLYPPWLTLWLMVTQALEGNASCLKAVANRQLMFPGDGASGSTAAFCKARARLGEETVEGLVKDADKYARGLVKDGGAFLGGRPLKAVDGTSFKAEDTAANRAEWNYASGQKEGCGFPTLGALCVFSLDTRTISAVSFSNHSAHDLRLTTEALRANAFEENDILVCDRAFCAYPLFSILPSFKVDVITRFLSSRTLRKTVVKELGTDEWLESWDKPRNRQMKTLTEEENKAAPEAMTVRVIHTQFEKKGFRTKEVWLVTTLLDTERYPTKDIIEAYRRRWEIEGFFRDVKTWMGYEMVRGRTPASVRKQILAAFLAYNICQSVMLAATKGSREEQTRRNLTKVRHMLSKLMVPVNLGKELSSDAIFAIVNSTSTRKRERPGNPRCVKQRPKPYQFLTMLRAQFTELSHRGRRTKGRGKTSTAA